jgi:CheY-like chemotaxis protein
MNLFVNARDAMPSGGKITVGAKLETLEVEGQLKAGSYVKLSVTDEGEGMDESTLSRAVEPFFTTKGIGKGTGLGLAMVHGLAEQSNGKFSLTSTIGQGTTAALWLPISEEEIAAKAPTISTSKETTSQALRILAVDDDALVLANTATMLQELGHAVVEAASGKQALSILRSDSLDVVVTDYAMPGMTGEELAEAIKHEFPEMPILMVSGYADLAPGLVSNTFRLAKPFDEAALASAIAQVLSRKFKTPNLSVN